MTQPDFAKRYFVQRWLAAAAFLTSSLSGQSVSDHANKGLPDWLHVGGSFRARYEGFLSRNFDPNQDDTHLVTRLRLDLQVRPTAWMRVVFQGQDARIYWNRFVPDGPPHSNPIDLRLGYLELGDPDKNPASLRIGRQELNFGEQRLLGSFDWINVARTFDAVRATFRRSGYRLDVFASSVVTLSSERFDRPQAGNNLHGAYGRIEKLVPGAVVEPYVLWRLAPRQLSENGVTANLDFKTIGLRWAGTVRGGIDYGTEFAGQVGALGPDKVRAWGSHLVTGYTIPSVAWKPRISAEYNFASGDDNPHDGLRGTFDNLYPSPHDKYGVCDQVGWRNIHDVRFGWDIKPTSKLAVVTSYHAWWLANARDALYNPMGAVVARRGDGSAGTRVGQELDFQGTYTVSSLIQFAAGVGHIFPGEFLKKTTAGAGYTFPFVMFNYTF